VTIFVIGAVDKAAHTLMSRKSYRLAAIAAAVILGAAGAIAWWLVSRGPDTISVNELQKSPPMVFVWARGNRGKLTGSGDLYVARPGDSAARRVRAFPELHDAPDGVPYGAYSASWSPDHRLIALDLSVWYGDPYGQAAVISADGRHLRKLSEASDVGDVTWSPQGTILYAYLGELRLVSPQDERTRRIWRPGRDVIPWRSSGGGADWAPDGRHFVFESSRGIFEISRNGRNVVRLTRHEFDGNPRWSPDGRLIAFVRRRACFDEPGCRRPASIYVVRPDGHGLRRLASPGRVGTLAWSPDNRRILFTLWSWNETVPHTIRVAAVDGGRPHTLAKGDAIGWSPDGTKILFRRDDGLWVMDADGGRKTHLRFNRPGRYIIDADW
jgi:Tol biopolymer transport system component